MTIRFKQLPFMLIGLLLLGCGPDTIFVRPGLDTPSQHVANGQQFLKRGKIDDAGREFLRAEELLAPQFVKVYIGMGLVQGHKGDFEAGFKAMAKAKEIARSPRDLEAVQKGIDRINEMKRLQKASQTP